MTINFPPASSGGGDVFDWPVIAGGIITPDYSLCEDVATGIFIDLGWATIIRFAEDMNIDAFMFITGTTAWSGRTIGIFNFDATGFNLGSEVASVSSLSPAADTQVTSTFSSAAVLKNTPYWLAAGGGTGTSRGLVSSIAQDTGASTRHGLTNKVGGLVIDLSPSQSANFQLEQTFQLTSNTPAASGGLQSVTLVSDGYNLPIVGVRKA